MSRIPPLPALKAFLAACRAGSYSAAAEELNVTHGAISRQIQTLEEWLGQKLFERAGQRMAPTPHALAFAVEVGEAFERINDAAERYGKGSASMLLRVSAPATFAMRWLIPRLDDFHQRHPGMLIQVQTATTQQISLAGSFDLAIRRGSPQTGHFSAQAFLDEWLTLVAAPSLLARQPLDTLMDLHRHVLLETETRPGDWQQWLNAAGYRAEGTLRRQRFDHFYVTYSALIDGLGLGVGPMPTLEHDVTVGRLVQPFADLRTPSRRYYSLTPAGVSKTLIHRRFEDWLVEQGNLGDSDK
ncbi:LysR substrate-binding domain-containing protein [Pseudomonas vancouverensis]|uniref:LysR family transcriptional regulator n=1 Tax=Pseudomonas vancouverensis TaxID=95300 RepID=A0A1H2N333_PSEVA|nr:LysR substrate-binding domain-containing protein [Pseudomonas vancouverensis]KAB0495774.1 LysR family transcriptional regulator [Pseudomonas vancouverensis]TDB65576.1 LysR family transcriptional regulator [Pseudomonas vancouverensis]SDU99495.1 DNA-binding transcriptional regulator, LysR family [Pseudomonas vancouverensis]